LWFNTMRFISRSLTLLLMGTEPSVVNTCNSSHAEDRRSLSVAHPAPSPTPIASGPRRHGSRANRPADYNITSSNEAASFPRTGTWRASHHAHEVSPLGRRLSMIGRHSFGPGRCVLFVPRQYTDRPPKKRDAVVLSLKRFV
jgi:hypothetical protein